MGFNFSYFLFVICECFQFGLDLCSNLVNPLLNKPWFLCVSNTSLLKILWEKGEIAISSFPTVFSTLLNNFPSLYSHKLSLWGVYWSHPVCLYMRLSVRLCVMKSCQGHNFKNIKASNFRLHTQIGHIVEKCSVQEP